MKRLHMHVSVEDLDLSVAFYAALFAAPPTVRKPDYAKWRLDDPRVNFTLSTRAARTGVDHVGIEVATAEELAEVHGRLAEAGRPVTETRDTTCCYARSEKAWTADPSGLPWEFFVTTGESTSYGVRAGLSGPDRARRAANGCCPAR